MSRTCGTCQVCCWIAPVTPLNKPARTDCEHQCSDGCAIYAKRPQCCATYQCAFIDGTLPDWARPDKCGVLFEVFEHRAFTPPLRMVLGQVVDAVLELKHRHAFADAVPDELTVIVVADAASDAVRLYGSEQALTAYRVFEQHAQQSGDVRVVMGDGEIKVKV